MASVKISLSLTNARKSNLRSIVLYVYHKRNKAGITLKIPPVHPENFISLDHGAEILAREKNYPNRTWANQYLCSEWQFANRIIQEFTETGRLYDLSATELAQIIKVRGRNKSNANITFTEFAEKIIEERLSIGKYNTARTIQDSLNAFMRFFEREILFSDITYANLVRFDLYSKQRGKSINAIASNLRYMRAVYKRAIKEDIITPLVDVWTKFSIKTEKTAKRAITPEQVRLIVNYQTQTETEELVKDMFLFSFYNAGINFKDVAYLRPQNIVHGRLIYSRGKTADKFNYQLNENSLKIIEKYKNQSPIYLFPIILNPGAPPADVQRNVQNRNCQLNKVLKRIGQTVGIGNLSTYVARHTYATIAMNKHVPVAMISRLLGHEDIRTTQIYLDTLNCPELDTFNALITEI